MAVRPHHGQREDLPPHSSSSEEPSGRRVTAATPLERPREAGSHVPARKPCWWEAIAASNRRRRRELRAAASVAQPAAV